MKKGLALIFFCLCSYGLFSAELSTEEKKTSEHLSEKMAELDSLDAVRALIVPELSKISESKEKGLLLANIASLEFLAGSRLLAAEYWIHAHSFTGDDTYLLDAVRALLLSGEYSAGRAHLDRLLARGRDAATLRSARELLHTLETVIQGNYTGDMAKELNLIGDNRIDRSPEAFWLLGLPEK